MTPNTLLHSWKSDLLPPVLVAFLGLSASLGSVLIADPYNARVAILVLPGSTSPWAAIDRSGLTVVQVRLGGCWLLSMAPLHPRGWAFCARPIWCRWTPLGYPAALILQRLMVRIRQMDLAPEVLRAKAARSTGGVLWLHVPLVTGIAQLRGAAPLWPAIAVLVFAGLVQVTAASRPDSTSGHLILAFAYGVIIAIPVAQMKAHPWQVDMHL